MRNFLLKLSFVSACAMALGGCATVPQQGTSYTTLPPGGAYDPGYGTPYYSDAYYDRGYYGAGYYADPYPFYGPPLAGIHRPYRGYGKHHSYHGGAHKPAKPHHVDAEPAKPKRAATLGTGRGGKNAGRNRLTEAEKQARRDQRRAENAARRAEMTPEERRALRERRLARQQAAAERRTAFQAAAVSNSTSARATGNSGNRSRGARR